MLTVDRLAFDLLRSVKLPEEWHKEIERMIQSMDVVRKIENRRIEIDEELRRAGRAFADGAFNEEDYDRRRKKLFAEKDSLILPDGAKTIEIGMQLENIGDFLEEATNDEKYKIFHILFDTISYDFSKKKMVKFKPHTEFVHIFRLAAPMSDWTETDGYIFQVEKQ